MVNNKVILMGRLTRDAKIMDSKGEDAGKMATFSLAVDKMRKKQEPGNDADAENNAHFIRCIGFDRNAEFLEKFGGKGVKFIVEGRIQTGSYTNKDGVKVYTSDVVVEHMEFAESKGTSAPDEAAFLEIPEEMIAEMPFR